MPPLPVVTCTRRRGISTVCALARTKLARARAPPRSGQGNVTGRQQACCCESESKSLFGWTILKRYSTLSSCAFAALQLLEPCLRVYWQAASCFSIPAYCPAGPLGRTRDEGGLGRSVALRTMDARSRRSPRPRPKAVPPRPPKLLRISRGASLLQGPASLVRGRPR